MAHFSGTIRLSATSMSVRTEGSAFSFNDRDADVCWIKTFMVPTLNLESSGTAATTSRVMRWYPRPGALTVMVFWR